MCVHGIYKSDLLTYHIVNQVSQQPMDLTQNPYSYLESQLYMLQHNIAVLSGKELDGMEQWLSVFNQSLEQTMMNATMGGLSELR